MKLRFLGLMLIFLMNGSLVSSIDKVTLKTVVIDAGHGGKDPGAVGKIIQEKMVALSIALKLGASISQAYPDIRVVYTRDKDVFIPLDERAKIANKAKADLFISIHANMISNPKTKGTETFVLGLHRSEDNLEVAKKENSVIVMEDDYTTKYEGFDPNLSESYIIFELMQNVYLDQSILMASNVQLELNRKSTVNDRGVKQAGFLVLRQVSMPSVLIETGFLSNAEEEKYLASPNGQEEIATSIFNAFQTYKLKFEAKSTIQPIVSKPKLTASEPSSGVTFKIQIASSSKKLRASEKPISQFKDVSYYVESKIYKYTVNTTSNPAEATEALKKVKKSIKDAFIVAFDSTGNKLSSSETKKLLKIK